MHHDYGAALNAFTFAVLGSLAEFQKGVWSLPLSRASEWVRSEWLDKLTERGTDTAELENIICLASFGAQDLEILIPDEALV
ncbi:MAG: hypothetical protein ABI318_12785 [Chthoniobacteraceae bacterium]